MFFVFCFAVVAGHHSIDARFCNCHRLHQGSLRSIRRYLVVEERDMRAIGFRTEERTAIARSRPGRDAHRSCAPHFSCAPFHCQSGSVVLEVVRARAIVAMFNKDNGPKPKRTSSCQCCHHYHYQGKRQLPRSRNVPCGGEDHGLFVGNPMSKARGLLFPWPATH